MQILIDIPDEQIEKSLAESKYIHEDEGEKGSVHIALLYTNKKLEFVDISRKTDFYSLTDKYTILPKGHGRLIDADELLNRIAEKCKTPSLSENTVNGLCGATAIIYDMLIESGQEKDADENENKEKETISIDCHLCDVCDMSKCKWLTEVGRNKFRGESENE